MGITTIQLDSKLKFDLDKLKVHKRESYNDLIFRLIKNNSSSKLDKVSLIETIEVLSDPQLMKGIKEALEDSSSEISLEDFERELGL